MADPAHGPLVVLVGPTAVGKSAVAVAVARRLGAEILSADSTCVYRGLEFGTDKPDAGMRSAVAHHLLDIVAAGERFSLADWLAAARSAILAVRRAGRLPIVVGGTGLYVRALLEGYVLSDEPPSPVLRRRLEWLVARAGAERVHATAVRRFPQALARVHPRDAYRLVRALERSLAGGEIRRAPPYLPPPGVVVAELTRPRDELYARIDARAAVQWTGDALLEETAAALARGASRRAPPLAGLVYRQAVAVLAGTLTEAEGRRLAARDTRRLAKRQMTFWRRDAWLTRVPAGDAARAEEALMRLSARALGEAAP